MNKLVTCIVIALLLFVLYQSLSPFFIHNKQQESFEMRPNPQTKDVEVSEESSAVSLSEEAVSCGACMRDKEDPNQFVKQCVSESGVVTKINCGKCFQHTNGAWTCNS